MKCSWQQCIFALYKPFPFSFHFFIFLFLRKKCVRLSVAWNTQESFFFFFCHWAERLIAPQLQQTWIYKSVCRAWLMWVRHVSGLLRCMWIKLRLRLAFIICTWNFHQVVCNMLNRLTKQNYKFCHTNCPMQYTCVIHPSHTELGVWKI